MLADAARNYELVTLELHEHFNELDKDLKKEFEELIERIEHDLISGVDLEDSLDETIEKIFPLRLKALRWLFKRKEFDFDEKIQEAQEIFTDLDHDSRLDILVENTQFALRVIKRVSRSLFQYSSTADHKKKGQKRETTIPIVDYWTYYGLLSLTVRDEQLLEKIMDCVDASLELEYGILAALIIKNEKPVLSDETINDLSELIASAAQEYSALARELGITKMNVVKFHSYPQKEDDEFINEQQHLADSGLEDWKELDEE